MKPRKKKKKERGQYVHNREDTHVLAVAVERDAQERNNFGKPEFEYSIESSPRTNENTRNLFLFCFLFFKSRLLHIQSLENIIFISVYNINVLRVFDR